MKKVLLLLVAAAVIMVSGSGHVPAAIANAGEMAASATIAPEATPMTANNGAQIEMLSAEEEPEAIPEPTAEPTPEPTPEGRYIDPDKPMVALTFDDGPCDNTDRLLDIFAEHGGKCTLFMLGQAMDYYADTLVRAAEEGHEVASHSWYHPELTTLDYQGITDQLADTRDKIFEITGKEANLMRPPYGSTDDRVVAVAEHEGISLIKWSVDTMDWATLNADAVYESVMSEAYDGAIILCHDLHSTTVDAMERAVPDLIEAGYQLVTITELLTARGGEVEAGMTYHDQTEFY